MPGWKTRETKASQMPKTLENNKRCVSRCFLQANWAHAAAKQNDAPYQLQAGSSTQAPAVAHLRNIQIKSKKPKIYLAKHLHI